MDKYIVQPTSAFLQRQELAKKMKTNEEPAAPTSSSSSIFDLTGDSDIEMQAISGSTDSKKVVEPPNATSWGQLFAKPAPTDSVPSFVGGSYPSPKKRRTSHRGSGIDESILISPQLIEDFRVQEVPNSDVILQFNSSGYNPLDHLPVEWEQNRMQIDMRIFGFGSGNIVYQNLCEASSNGLSASAGAGNMLDTGVPKPPSELGESDEQITAKYKAWSIEVQLKRKYLQKVCEHLLAGRYPPEDTSTPFVPRPGTLAARVSLPNSGCSSAVMFANQLETTGFRRAPNGMGPGKALAEMASKCLKEIRRIRGDPNFKVPAGAVGMPGATGRAMDASIKLSDLRRLFPGRDFSAAEVGMPGGAGRNIDASIKLRALRDLYPDLIVTAEMCGVTGGAGKNIDAAIVSANLPLMKRNPSLYSGSIRDHLEEQQAQHRNLIAQGVLFSVDGKARTPCQAHLELELKLKSLNTREPSFSASFSLQKAYERMGEKGNLRFVKVCSTHATSTSPGVEGFDIYAYYPPPALSSAQSASSSIDSNVVQELVRPSAFSLLKPSTGAPLKRTVGRVHNGSFKCTWPGCTHPPFSRTTDMKRHFNSHTVGSTEVKRGGASHQKNLKK